VWALLGFAVWTILLLLGTVGVYRWSRILTGRVPIREFRADRIEGEEWYKRAMRAHSNCLENLPVFGAIVLALYASGIDTAAVGAVCVLILAARVAQSVIHVGLDQTNTVVSVRFGFFLVQIAGFLWLAATVVLAAERA
jgi:uncharacterized MAPEG superfamily protein